MLEKLQAFIDRFDEITLLLSNEKIAKDAKKIQALGKESSQINQIAIKSKEYKQILQDIDDNKALLEDKEMAPLAKEELKELEITKDELLKEINILLIPKDPNDEKNVIVELRAGAGGDEAAIFVGDLFKTYLRYIDNEKWKCEILNQSESESGGFKEVVFLVKGASVYSKFKFESGVHRVQRVPQTESQGRVHTSAITVAVLSEADDDDIEIDSNDLKIDVMRASGNGGQSVNTTDSAVRITHIPSGIVVTNQDQKSQHKNKDKAMKVLKARLYDLQQKQKEQEEGDDRREQIGSGDRSAKIRTYNYPQGRITDHRIGLTLYKLEAIMQSGELNEITEALIAHTQAEAIKN
jgi:peptide chain release factor 1